MFFPRIKICGITRVDDAIEAARLGVDAIGLVFYTRSPRYVTLKQAQAITKALPPFVTIVALFVDPSNAEVDQVLAALPVDVLQFHGVEPPAFCRSFARPYLKAVRVRPGVDFAQLAREYYDARGLVVDAYVEGTPGGTGKMFDWRLLPNSCALPLILSGGLDANSVKQALALQPAAVDVSSGVESEPGFKDHHKMAAFVLGVRHSVPFCTR